MQRYFKAPRTNSADTDVLKVVQSDVLQVPFAIMGSHKLFTCVIQLVRRFISSKSCGSISMSDQKIISDGIIFWHERSSPRGRGRDDSLCKACLYPPPISFPPPKNRMKRMKKENNFQKQFSCRPWNIFREKTIIRAIEPHQQYRINRIRWSESPRTLAIGIDSSWDSNSVSNFSPIETKSE